jgi:hypothetical protein
MIADAEDHRIRAGRHHTETKAAVRVGDIGGSEVHDLDGCASDGLATGS